MRSKQLGKSPIWQPVVNQYRHDPHVQFTGRKFFNTAEGIQIQVDNASAQPLDVRNSLDTTLYLTGKRKLSDFIKLVTPAQQYPRTYITYFADTYGWTDRISPDTKCWYVEPSTKTQEQMERLNELPNFNFTTPYSKLSPSMLFEVELLDDMLLRIGHWDGYKKTMLTSNDRHLTVNFQFENNLPLNKSNPQVFEYSIQDDIACVNIYRQIENMYYEFRYVPQYKNFAYVLTTGYTYIPNTYKNSVSRLDQQELILNESWVSYNKSLDMNDLTINESDTKHELSHNYLLNTEYVYDDGPVNNYNIITLKNHLTNESTTSKNNPFAGSVDRLTLGQNEPESSSLFREYTSINTGPGDKGGYENLYLSYNDYTRQLTFKPDEVTYFHMPPSMYPYNRINVSDAGLIDCGAIAGDQPLKSDKIFKKRADYASFSPWGNPVDEQSGNFLCTWLYWSGKSSDSPMWLDRYYNPRKHTIHQALTAKPLVQFVTTFDNITLEKPEVEDHVVFDKKSDLCFEPEAMYCYHHIGPTDVKNVVDQLKNNITQQDLATYRNSSNNEVIPEFDGDQPVYTFNSARYGYTNTLADLAITNSYSINFNMYSSDWSKPFGHQLLGNYTNDGFGIFNKQLITPFYISTGNDVSLYNTDYVNVLDFPVGSLITVKNPATENIYIFNDDDGGTLYEYNVTGVLEEKSKITLYDKSTYPPKVIHPYEYASDRDHIYLVTSKDQYFTVSLENEQIKESLEPPVTLNHTSGLLPDDRYKYIVSNKQLYRVPGEPVLDTDGNILWIEEDLGNIRKYDIETGQHILLFQTRDYTLKPVMKIDVDNNMYIIYHNKSSAESSDYQIMKITRDREIVFNKLLSDYSENLIDYSRNDGVNVNLVSEFNTAGYQQYISLLTTYISSSTVVDIDTGEEVIITTPMSNEVQVDINTGESITSRVIPTPFSKLQNVFTDYDGLKLVYPDTNNNNELIFRTKVKNLYNRDEIDEIEAAIDVTDLPPGWRNISYDFNTVIGKILLFIDGELVNVHNFPPMKYRYSDVSINRYTVGATPYYGGVTLGGFLNKNDTYMCTNMKIKQLYIYNKSLNYYDLKFLYRQIGNIQSINWTIPGNSRNYLDEIQHVFAHKRPPMKSNIYNVNILCDSIQDTALRKKLTDDILQSINSDTPVNSQVDNVTWYNTK